jgi:hypothetical protein
MTIDQATLLNSAKMLWSAEANAVMQSRWDSTINRDLALARSKQAYDGVSTLFARAQSMRATLDPSGWRIQAFDRYTRAYLNAIALMLSRSRSPDIRIAYTARCLDSFVAHWDALVADIPDAPAKTDPASDQPIPGSKDPIIGLPEEIEDKVREILGTIDEASGQLYDLATKLSPGVAIAINHFRARWRTNEIELSPLPLPSDDEGTLPRIPRELKPPPPPPPARPAGAPTPNNAPASIPEQERQAISALKDRFPILEKLPKAAEILDSGLLLISVTIAVWHTIDADGKYAETAASNLSGILGGLAGAQAAQLIMASAAGEVISGVVDSAVTACMSQISAMIATTIAVEITGAATSVAVGIVTLGIGLVVGMAISSLIDLILNLCWGLGHQFPPSMLVRMSAPMSTSMHARMTAF